MRKIGLFVEGDTERGDARRRTLPDFFGRWLDRYIPAGKRVGIQAVKFHGVSNYLDDVAQKVALYLDDRRVNYVVGLIDLYGIPPNRIDLSQCTSVKAKVAKAKAAITALVPKSYRDRFVQHFSVHEIEAWLLAYPEEWPSELRAQITRRKPEEVNFNEPPARFLQRLLGRKYKKTVVAMNKFPKVDPQVAIDCCPYLKLLAGDLLAIARLLSQ